MVKTKVLLTKPQKLIYVCTYFVLNTWPEQNVHIQNIYIGVSQTNIYMYVHTYVCRAQYNYFLLLGHNDQPMRNLIGHLKH